MTLRAIRYRRASAMTNVCKPRSDQRIAAPQGLEDIAVFRSEDHLNVCPARHTQ